MENSALPEENMALLQETVMHGRSLKTSYLTVVVLVLILLSCAVQDSASQGTINESNYEQIAALMLAIIRLPEEAALAGYFTVHEDPEVDCLTGMKRINPLGEGRVQVFYDACSFENISWEGGLEQPENTNEQPYQILFGLDDRDFGFFQTDSTFFAPFIEEIGFTFRGDLSVNHVDQSDILTGSILDIQYKNNFFDNVHSFRNLNVNRSYDSGAAHYEFSIIAEISSDLIPTVDCEVLTRFERYEDQYPHKGKMSIVALHDNSQMEIEVVANGAQILLKLDSDNNNTFEIEQFVYWGDIKQILPNAYQALFSYYWHS